MKKLMIVVATTVILLASAGATVVTSIPGGTVTPMPALNYFGPGPQSFGPGNWITWSSTNATNQGGSVFGYTGGYGYLANGFWDGSLGPMAGLNDAFAVYGVVDTMTFAFATPVSAVGGFLNYTLDYGPATIAAWDAGGNLIESFNLTFATGGGTNTGFFYGFQESTPIKYFTLTDSYVGIVNLTTQAVPEPSSLLMLGSGVLGLLGIARRKLG
jgi:hypothetical protein